MGMWKRVEMEGGIDERCWRRKDGGEVGNRDQKELA
jgi:hypothetical protein